VRPTMEHPLNGLSGHLVRALPAAPPHISPQIREPHLRKLGEGNSIPLQTRLKKEHAGGGLRQLGLAETVSVSMSLCACADRENLTTGNLIAPRQTSAGTKKRNPRVSSPNPTGYGCDGNRQDHTQWGWRNPVLLPTPPDKIRLADKFGVTAPLLADP
jgi:hypothetical protein